MTNLASSPGIGTELSLLDPVESALARIGTLLDSKWELDALLGRGGMAFVYGARHRETRARVAIKVLLAELVQDEDVRERFVREARIANSIQHPAHVAVLEEGVSHRGEIFLVMELLEGTTLDVHVRDRGPGVTLADKLAFFDPVLDLLGECHAAGIVHRDIKPANIFVTQQGHIKVLDFGIARLRESRGAVEATKQGTVLGTPAFMAPEQALGLSDLVDGRADLWAVGACMFMLITGRRVHEARSENESMVLTATRAAESIALAAPHLPVEVVAFVDRALAHDKRRRFADAKTMRAALASVVSALQSGRAAPRAPPESRKEAVRTQITRDAAAERSPELREKTLEALRSVWKHLGHFLAANAQYGAGHSLTLQPMRVALEEIGSVLATRPDALSWDVSPYAFTYAKSALWEVEKVALERLSFHVFSHGMRRMQLKAGLTEDELRRFLAIATRDTRAGITLTEDPVADLWAQRFEHIGYLAIDVFASGSAEEVDAFESEAQGIAERMTAVARVGPALGRTRAADDDQTGEGETLEARALQANLLDGLGVAAAVASASALDVRTRMLGAQLVLPRARWDERFLDVVSAALAEAKAAGDLPRVIATLAAWTTSDVKRGEVALALERFASLTAGAAPEVAGSLARAMFDAATFARVLDHADAPLAPAVARVLDRTGDASLLAPALAGWVATPDGPLSSVLLAYVERWIAGHEALVTPHVEQGAPKVALALLGLAKDGGKEALAALRSVHPEVRRAGLKLLRSGEEAQAELQKLLVDPDLDVRCDALTAVARVRLRALGPAIVRRIQEPTFPSIDGREKREWLACLHVLNAVRAEEIVIEMLERAPFFPSEANDRNRVIAAQILATADTDTALAALRAAARVTRSNSPVVREAATAAAAAISARREAP